MRDFERRRYEALTWWVEELKNSFAESRDPALFHEMLQSVDEAERDPALYSVFLFALRARDWELAEICIQEGIDLFPAPSDGSGGPILDAMESLGNRPDVIAWLLERDVGVDRPGRFNITPLMRAAMCGWAEMLKLLLEHGADVETSTGIDGDWTALMFAAAGGEEEAVRLLLEAGADAMRRDVDGADAVQISQRFGHENIAKLIGDWGQHEGQKRRKRP